MPKILDKPLSWEKIVKLIDCEEYQMFGRSIEVCKKYRQDKKKNKMLFNSSRDMILIKYLNYKPVVSKNDRIVGIQNKKKKCIDKVLCCNTFPYSVGEGIDHKLLWATKDLTDKEIVKFLDNKLFGIEYVYFRNPEYLRSIADIFHIHIFCKYEKIK